MVEINKLKGYINMHFELMFSKEWLKLMGLNQLTSFYFTLVSTIIFKNNFSESYFAKVCIYLYRCSYARNLKFGT